MDEYDTTNISFPSNDTKVLQHVPIYRTVDMAFAVGSCAISLYIVIALCRYVWVVQVQANKSTKKKPSSIFDAFSIVSGVTVLVYNLVELPLLTTQHSPFCEIQSKIKTACGAVLYIFVYFSLWYRIYRLFYSQKYMKSMTSCTSRFLSRATIVVMIASVIIGAWKFLSARPYKTTKDGCVKLKSQGLTGVKWGFLLGTTVTFQILLLYLLVYPLLMHRRRMECHGFDAAKIIPLIKKAFIVSLICILSDSAIAVFATTTPQELNYMRHIVYGSNMLTNLLASLYSFSHWKKRLWPWKMRTDTSKAKNGGDNVNTNSKQQSSIRQVLARARRNSRKDSIPDSFL